MDIYRDENNVYIGGECAVNCYSRNAMEAIHNIKRITELNPDDVGAKRVALIELERIGKECARQMVMIQYGDRRKNEEQ